jgi:hypothetical protein
MALNWKRHPRIELLTRQAAGDIQLHNPHLIAPQLPFTETEYAELEQEQQELERIWNEIDHQPSALSADEPGAHAVDEDRGE